MVGLSSSLPFELRGRTRQWRKQLLALAYALRGFLIVKGLAGRVCSWLRKGTTARTKRALLNDGTAQADSIPRTFAIDQYDSTSGLSSMNSASIALSPMTGVCILFALSSQALS